MWQLAVAAGGSLLSGILGARSASKAAKAQQRAAAEAQRINEQRYQEGLSMFAPYREAGANALSGLETASGLRGNDAMFSQYMNSPFARTALDEAQRAIAARGANAGNLFSGANLKAAADGAMRGVGAFHNEYRQGLSNLANMGQDAVRGSVGLGQYMTGQSQQNLQNFGQAQAQGIAGRYNALASGLQGAAGAFNYYGNQGNEAIQSKSKGLSSGPYFFGSYGG